MIYLLFFPEDGGTRLLLRFGKYLPHYMASRSKIVSCHPQVVGFEVLTERTVKSTAFWDVMQCNAVEVN
jgi:hypothetical protein